MQKTKDADKNLKVAREKRQITFNGAIIRLIANFAHAPKHKLKLKGNVMEWYLQSTKNRTKQNKTLYRIVPT